MMFNKPNENYKFSQMYVARWILTFNLITIFRPHTKNFEMKKNGLQQVYVHNIDASLEFLSKLSRASVMCVGVI